MKIAVKNVDLSRELNLLEKIVGQKPTIAVLGNVLIQAAAGSLVLSATDLEIGLVGACEADVEEAGAVTLPAKKLMELVRAQSDATLILAKEPKGVRFTCGSFTSKLQALPATDFPGIPVIDGHPSIQIPRAPLKDMIAQVRYAISDKGARYYMNGAYLGLKEGELTLVSTDGARMSLTSTKRDGIAWEPSLIPEKALDELFALLAEAPTSDHVTFARSEKHLFFDLDGRLLISRMVDGKFPAYERMIPQANNYRMVIDRLKLVPVLKRLVLIEAIVALTFDTDALTVSSLSVEVGEGAEAIPATYDGPKMEMRFKGQFLLDFLSAAAGDKVTLNVKDPMSAMLFSDGEHASTNYFNVIMGMR